MNYEDFDVLSAIATEVRRILDKVKIISPQRIFCKCRKFFFIFGAFCDGGKLCFSI